MTDTVTIPAGTARRIAAVLRGYADTVPRSAAAAQWGALADMLDPPPRLRDEVARVMEPLLLHDTAEDARQATEEILAVVRRHVEALDWDVDSGPTTAAILRHDVLRLLGGDQ